jgi:hypothetical protein
MQVGRLPRQLLHQPQLRKRLGQLRDTSMSNVKTRPLLRDQECQTYFSFEPAGRPAALLCDLALFVTKIRSLITEEISPLSVLKFPFRALTPSRPAAPMFASAIFCSS